MKQFEYKITDSLGIHARPAGLLVKTASAFSSAITIEKGDKNGDCKRIFAVMGLGVKCGDTVTFKIEGADENEAKNVLEKFMEENL